MSQSRDPSLINKTKNMLVVLVAGTADPSPTISIGYDGEIECANFKPDETMMGFIQALRSVFFHNPLGAARVMIDVAERQTAVIKEQVDAMDDQDELPRSQ